MSVAGRRGKRSRSGSGNRNKRRRIKTITVIKMGNLPRVDKI
jgi:hypothetical protein